MTPCYYCERGNPQTGKGDCGACIHFEGEGAVTVEDVRAGVALVRVQRAARVVAERYGLTVPFVVLPR